MVATTVWEAALAKAAGAKNVTSIVPAAIRHAPDYDVKPSDLAKVAEADHVLYSSFEPFAYRIKEAAGSKAQMTELNLDNSPSKTTANVTRLGKAFGTEKAAARWNATFGKEWESLHQKVKASWPGGKAPAVTAQMFTTWAAELAGADMVGTYGPEAVTPASAVQVVREEAEVRAGQREHVDRNGAARLGCQAAEHRQLSGAGPRSAGGVPQGRAADGEGVRRVLSEG